MSEWAQSALLPAHTYNNKTKEFNFSFFLTSCSYYHHKEEEVDIPGEDRQPPLGPDEWNSFFDEEGRIRNEAALRSRIFYGVGTHSMEQSDYPFC